MKNKITKFKDVVFVTYGERETKDEVPEVLYVLRENKDDPNSKVISVAFQCPCGCGAGNYLPVDPEYKFTRWDYSFNDGKVTISPSILDKGYCKAHYFIRDNRVDWCN